MFASSENEKGETMMSYSDFLQCLTPYHFGELISEDQTKDYLKEHTPTFLKYADVNGDGLISFTEFIFFLTISQISIG